MFKCLHEKDIDSFKKLSLWELLVVNTDEESNVLFLDLGGGYGVCSFCDNLSNCVLTISVFHFVFTSTQ